MPKEKPKDKNALTLSALLNSLDGVTSVDGRVVFMTTNFPEKLDIALIRPGRIDRHEVIESLGPNEIRRLYLRFFPGQEDFINGISIDFSVPGATLQEHFIKHRDDYKCAALTLKDLNPGSKTKRRTT